MKKILILCCGFVFALSMYAQSVFPLQFADKNGNIVPDGCIFERRMCEIDAFGKVVMPSQLWVKNISNEPVQAGASYSILSISSGVLQTCFPANCVRQGETGTFNTETGEIAAGELKDLSTEWLPDSEGSCSLTYQLKTYRQNPNNGKWMVDVIGPKVTLTFNYVAPTGIDQDQVEKNIVSTAYYDLQGQPVAQPIHGLFIKKLTYADGTNKMLKQYIY